MSVSGMGMIGTKIKGLTRGKKRIAKHPVLHQPQKSKWLRFTFNGQPLMAREGEMISTALFAHDIKIFNKHDISCIPVVDDEHKPVGIISWRDILKTL